MQYTITLASELYKELYSLQLSLGNIVFHFAFFGFIFNEIPYCQFFDALLSE